MSMNKDAFKNILWVEDFDQNQADHTANLEEGEEENLDRTEDIAEWFEEDFGRFVEVIESPLKAVNLFDNERFRIFDCVVLDINLEKGFDGKGKEFKDFKSRLEGGGIQIESEKSLSKENIKKDAGYFLYLYLLRMGFPSERVLILTANTGDQTKKWDENFKKAHLKPPDYVEKNNKNVKNIKEFHERVKSMYKSSNGYYRMRSIVLNACSYWREKMNSADYSSLYYDRKKSLKTSGDKGWETPLPAPEEFKEAYKGTLREAELLFDRRKPKKDDVEYVYSNALRCLTRDFEAEFNFDDDSESFTDKTTHAFCLRAMKLLRNWLAHNKFETPPKDDEFLLLFLIAMRAYSRVEGSKILTYEEDAFSFIGDGFKKHKNNGLKPEGKEEKKAKDISRKIYKTLYYKSSKSSKGIGFSTHYNMMLEWYGGKGRSDPPEYDLFLRYVWTEVFKMTDPFGNEESENKPIIESRYSEFNEFAPFLARIADALYPKYKDL